MKSVRAACRSPFLLFFSAAVTFWAYMLHCADRSFYADHTENLEARLAAHESGQVSGYSATRLPVTLVRCEEFPTRAEALAAERRIKGWSRAKKLALIRGDWPLISALARSGSKKERASTGSARTVAGSGAMPVAATRAEDR
jgi:predicted GIY-YIG superfamily endonuclease